MVNFNVFRYFMAVMEAGKVTTAAARLHVTQPTVSYNLRVLQRQLGEKLFTTGPHGICPSPRAHELFHQLKPYYVGWLSTLDRFIHER